MAGPTPPPVPERPPTAPPRGPGRRAVRRTALVTAVPVLVLAGAAAVSVSAVSSASEDPAEESTTLRFDVRFSPLALIATNNERDPGTPLALGDANVFHDQLLVDGERVGDEVGSCVIAALTPGIVADCGIVVRLADGHITGQFATSPGPAPKPIALTGGTGAYRGIGGEGTLVEFGDETGTLTLEVVPAGARGADD